MKKQIKKKKVTNKPVKQEGHILLVINNETGLSQLFDKDGVSIDGNMSYKVDKKKNIADVWMNGSLVYKGVKVEEIGKNKFDMDDNELELKNNELKSMGTRVVVKDGRSFLE